MRKVFFLLLVFAELSPVYAQESFQLAPPVVKLKSAYIRDSAVVEVYFNQPGAAVHYTFQARDPLPTDPVYHSAITVKKAGILRLKSIGKDYKPSETLLIPFYEAGKKIDNISTSAPQEYYANQKPETLNDAVGGIANFRSGNWTGYNSDSVWIECKWNKPAFIQQVELALLQDEASWIFLPKRIECWAKDEITKKWKLIKFKDIPSTAKGPKQLSMQNFVWKKGVSTTEIKIIMINHNKIPAWHESKGERAWIFLDEIVVR